jgi:CRP/FNR family transcriptional regulator, cyclic AMP receptor protein
MKVQKLEALSKIEIFQDLSEHEMAEMDRTTTMSTCNPGRVFYGPEETGEVLFLLKRGKVQIYRLSPEGKKLIVAVLEKGAIFGEMSLVGQGMHNTFAEAVEECTLCVMSRRDVERLLVDKPQVAIRFMEVMARRLTQAETKLEDMAFKGIPARLATLLLQLTQTNPAEDAVEGYTHQDLAEMVGTYRETTTQTLNQFKQQGWIGIERKRIRLIDRLALEEQAAL